MSDQEAHPALPGGVPQGERAAAPVGGPVENAAGAPVGSTGGEAAAAAAAAGAAGAPAAVGRSGVRAAGGAGSTEGEPVGAAAGVLTAMPFQQLGVIVVGMSLAVWWPAFTLGAWGEVFFDNLLEVWAAATAAFVLAMLLPAARRRIGWSSLTLLLPSLWLVLSIVIPNGAAAIWVDIVALVGALAVVLGIPFMIWALAKVVWPDFGDAVPARGRLLVIFVVLIVAVASFLLGANESHFLTCEDFSISGNSEPPGCVHATP